MTMTVRAPARTVGPVVAAQPQDVTLLARIVAGDGSALASAYDLHADLVFGLARRVTRDEQLARDITQEVFAYLWELPARVDLARGSLRTYLAVVTHRRSVDEVRRTERRAQHEARLAAVTVEDGPENDVVDEQMHSWRRRQITSCLAQLPDDQRAAIELAYYDGLTYRQVALALDIPEGTAKSRLRLAMTKLRTLLGNDMRAAI